MILSFTPTAIQFLISLSKSVKKQETQAIVNFPEVEPYLDSIIGPGGWEAEDASVNGSMEHVLI